VLKLGTVHFALQTLNTKPSLESFDGEESDYSNKDDHCPESLRDGVEVLVKPKNITNLLHGLGSQRRGFVSY